MMRLRHIHAAALLALCVASKASAREALIFDGSALPLIIHAPDRTATLAAELLARDLKALSGQDTKLSDDPARCPKLCIVIGEAGSPLVQSIVAETGVDLSQLNGEWERYGRALVRSRRNAGHNYLLIAGSDARGTVWGVIDLTRELGVSPWEWWADVSPRRTKRLAVDGALRFSSSPSARYRGIFLNDEDWGLQPWAAKTFEPETGDIGPKTYGRIFELMWRLKANLIWPAMHDSTRPFYQIAGNTEAARDYSIVVGTSHAEPMLRNNVREWDEAKDGPFNFFTNRERMVNYWRVRAEEVKGAETITTIGLRGKHDSALEGADTTAEARDATQQAIGIQRQILADVQGRAASDIPQALTLYKEVLDIYRLGLPVPDDVTLVWPEDNYGYLSLLPNAAERARRGGSGLYYHISYWGRPHDYLWLATTHPALIREQLDRAWQMEARKLWVVNVGDIKPGEYLTEYFLATAFDRGLAKLTPDAHLAQWATREFGATFAPDIAGIMRDYYDLAFERRPEFMGFGQTEPTRPNQLSPYALGGGREAEQRIDAYRALTARAEAVAARLPADRQHAYFQLVLYPVRAAASLNERNLLVDLAAVRTRQGRHAVNDYVAKARTAHARIVADTAHYNSLNAGKWRHMMDMAPRRLPVFDEPFYPTVQDRPVAGGCLIDAAALTFVEGRPASHSFTIYSRGKSAAWSISDAPGLKLSATSGRLDADNGFEQRVTANYSGSGRIAPATIYCDGRNLRLSARLVTPAANDAPVEIDRIISITATSADSEDWEAVPGLGSRGEALRAKLDLPSRPQADEAVPLDYRFETGAISDAEMRIVALPVHPLTGANGLRIGIRIDDGPTEILDFRTYGRSEEWKRNVLSNSTVCSLRLNQLAKGQHRLRIFALDPGFILDRIDVRLDGAPEFYGAPPIR